MGHQIWILVAAVCLACLPLTPQKPIFPAASERQPVIATKPVSHKDLPYAVDLRGRLTRPLCTLVKIRGTWIKSDLGLCFHVHQVNDLKLVDKVVFRQNSIRKILWDRYKGVTNYAGHPWDWSIGAGGDEDPPLPVEGQEREMLGIETAQFHLYSPAVWAELRHFDPVASPPEEGFVTSFEFLAIKKLK